MTGDAAVFGASGGAEEYGSQKAEIAGGKRTEIDPSAILEQTKSGAEMGAVFKLLGGGGGHDPSEKPAEDTHPANEPVKQPSFAGTGRDGVQTGGEAHIERADSAIRGSRVEQARAPGGGSGRCWGNRPSPPADPASDPTAASRHWPLPKATPTPGVSEQQAASVEQPGVAQPPPSPAGTASEAPQRPDTTGQAAPPPPPPSSQPAAPLAQPDAALVAQHADLITGKKTPRDFVVYPPDVQPLDLPKKGGVYGTTRLDDGRTVQYYRHGPNQLRDADKVKFFAERGGLETAPEFVAEAQPAAAAEGVQEAPAAAAEAAPAQTMGDRFKQAQADILARRAELDAAERGEFKPQPQAVQEPSVEPPTVAKPATPQSKESMEKLAESKAGVAIYRDTQGQLWKQGTAGKDFKPVSEKTARVIFPKVFGAPKPEEGERVLPAEQTVGEREDLKDAQAKQEATIQENLKALAARKAREAGEEAEKEQGEKHRGEEEKANIDRANQTAAQIVADHPQVGSYADTQGVINRAKAMARAAGKASLGDALRCLGKAIRGTRRW